MTLFVCLFVVVDNHLARSEEFFQDCLDVKLFISLPLFVTFYDRQGILGA